MNCFICSCEINDSESYLECQFCHNKTHYECLDPINQLVCSNCKNPYQPFLIINHMRSYDMLQWMNKFIETRVDDVNNDLETASKIIKVYADRIDNVGIKTFKYISGLIKDIQQFINNKSIRENFDGYIQTNELFDEVCDELKKHRIIGYIKRDFDEFAFAVRVNEIEAFVKLGKEKLYDLHQRYSTLGLIIDDYETYLSSFHSIFPNTVTDEKELDVLKYAFEHNTVFVSLRNIRVYPSEENISKLREINEFIERNFPEIMNIVLQTPDDILQELMNEKKYCKMIFPSKIFSKIGYKLVHHTFDKHINAINICEKCNGRVDDNYVCIQCKTRYCSECMKPLDKDHIDGTKDRDDKASFQDAYGSERPSTKGHICMQVDIDEWKMLQKTTKPCPICGLRIEKLRGCDDMFCTNCHNGFSWNTLAVKEGAFHNPERQKWLEETKKTSTKLSETFRKFPISDVVSFFNDLKSGYMMRDGSNRNIVNLFAEFDEKTIQLLLNEYKQKHLYVDMYQRKYKLGKDKISHAMFYKELEWFLMEVMIRVGKIFESDSKASDEEIMDTYSFIWNGCCVLDMIENKLKITSMPLIDNLRNNVRKNISSMMKGGYKGPVNMFSDGRMSTLIKKE